jgi:hypothetical protein
MEKVDLPEGSNGPWKVERFEVLKDDILSFCTYKHRAPAPGNYTRLVRNDEVIMSDTPAEMRDHSYAVYKARGSCLITGLGLGMVLKNILLKPEVTDVTVLELSQELIDLVGPHYASDPRVTIICTDALTWKAPKGKRWDWCWHDIWDNICITNLKSMGTLNRKYKANWKGCWAQGECRRYARSGY